MGWGIRIGNAVLEDDDDFDTYFVAVEDIPASKIKKIKPPLPAGEDDHYRAPSYSAWSAFVSKAGLDKGLYETEGCRRLREKDVKDLDAALFLFKTKYPDAVIIADSERERDYDLLRLEWLLFWVSWAVTNCKRPAISMG